MLVFVDANNVRRSQWPNLSDEELVDRVRAWAERHEHESVIVSDRTIDVHMTALRRKLGEGGAQIETVRGFGYRLSDEAREVSADSE